MARPQGPGNQKARRTPLARALLVAAGLALAAACQDCDDDIYQIPVPEDQIDVFAQKEAAAVDILWVVDNSESMAAEQYKIAGRFAEFFRQLLVSQVDYHIGVITTDPAEGGQLRAYDGPAVPGCDGCRFLTNAVGCANPDVATAGLGEAEIEQKLLDECHAQLVFRRLVTVGIDGTPFEEGFPSAAKAVGADVIDPATGFPTGEAPDANAGFLRPQASLYLIFVSDEDEGAKADGSPVRYYQRLFEGLKGAGNENLVSVSAITGWPLEEDVPTLDEVCGILQTTFDNNPANDDPRAVQIREIMNARTGCLDQSADEGDPAAYAEGGSRYIELACRTGGVVSNMCLADYSTALDRLGANAAGLLRKFMLSKPAEMDKGADCVLMTEDDPVLDCDADGQFDGPLDGPLCVKARQIGSADGDEDLIEQNQTTGWVWEESTNSVRFNGSFIPAPGSEVEIRYKLRQQGAAPCQ